MYNNKYTFEIKFSIRGMISDNKFLHIIKCWRKLEMQRHWIMCHKTHPYHLYLNISGKEREQMVTILNIYSTKLSVYRGFGWMDWNMWCKYVLSTVNSP